ncbi:MAG: major facilitator superfamily protein [Rhodobacteraceae bacterium]|uniref:MFS transporter n=1 Tax=Cypionkella sp. TaxID=2811411 RepID=UPI001329AD42|nr:MFS transporter [Cypionkella sp.]KAF0172364.1 MAG: major facilitator superfamily protein [Paracoccaceae bacterium]MDO8327526.1 MFS transporter [Cypionkella sp.]
MSALTAALRHPTLRLIFLALLALGAHNASVYPYQSLIAIERIGMSKPAFSLVLVLASVTAVSSSVLFGIWGDQHGQRRRIALIAALCSFTGLSLMLVLPGVVSLILCHGILLPVASSLYGQLFALARLATPPEHSRDGTQAALRSAMSISFLAMLIFWTFAFGTQIDVMAVYVSAGMAAFGLLVLIALYWPRDGSTDWQDQPSGLNLAQAFKEIAKGTILLRLLLLGAISSSGILYMVLISLVFEDSPVRDASDVALYVGMVAGWEVPCLLLLPRLAGRFRRSTLLAAGSAVYTLHLLALPLLSDTPMIWAMTLVAGIGGTAIISLPITYYQDLMQSRPGTAGAMLALQKLVADVLGAAAFALGTSFGSYGAVAVIGTVMALCGGFGLLWADRNHRLP